MRQGLLCLCLCLLLLLSAPGAMAAVSADSSPQPSPPQEASSLVISLGLGLGLDVGGTFNTAYGSKQDPKNRAHSPLTRRYNSIYLQAIYDFLQFGSLKGGMGLHSSFNGLQRLDFASSNRPYFAYYWTDAYLTAAIKAPLKDEDLQFFFVGGPGAIILEPTATFKGKVNSGNLYDQQNEYGRFSQYPAVGPGVYLAGGVEIPFEKMLFAEIRGFIQSGFVTVAGAPKTIAWGQFGFGGSVGLRL